MTRAIPDLSKARILITNDDGVQAKGIRLLFEIAKSLTDDVWVVAPENEQSGASHSLTLRRPLRKRRLAQNWYSVDGTPTDSVLMGITQILTDRRPDLVLSGINRGANLGEDVTYSGTVAGAREGVMLGIPAIAMSLIVAVNKPAKWETPREHGADLVRRLTSVGWAPNTIINVNFPNVAPDEVMGVEVAGLARRKLGTQWVEGVDPRGAPYYWLGMQREEEVLPGTDLHAVHDGWIAVTPVQLELVHRPTLDALKSALA
ncbi:MAG: 5'/3'-nucleotidase SurE [Rhodospirillaceae bacterium]|nr:5'/3'-nucleotidase SurE [Rhodospirillaceae bacterium]